MAWCESWRRCGLRVLCVDRGSYCRVVHSRAAWPQRRGYAQLARAMGIAEGSIVVCDRPLDTAAEVREVGKLLGSSPFLLVTSAYYMPRAMLMVRRTGANPIAAPTGQRAFGAARVTWRSLICRSRRPARHGTRNSRVCRFRGDRQRTGLRQLIRPTLSRPRAVAIADANAGGS